MKFWLAKYALSGGIKEVEGRLSADGDYASVDHGFYRLDREIFETEAAAKIRAEQMRIEKIASLKKQLAKLEKVSFQ